MVRTPTQTDWVKVKQLDSEESREELGITVSQTRKLHEDKEKRDRKRFETEGLNIEAGRAMITRPLKRKR